MTLAVLCSETDCVADVVVMFLSYTRKLSVTLAPT